MTSTRPSGSSATPEQNTLSGAVCVAYVPALGSYTSEGSGCCQPSNCSTLPLSMRIEWTVVMGVLRSGPQRPPEVALGVTPLDWAEGEPVPTLLVAVTVNV